MALNSLIRSKQVVGTLIDTKEKSGNTHKLAELYSRYDELCRLIAEAEESTDTR